MKKKIQNTPLILMFRVGVCILVRPGTHLVHRISSFYIFLNFAHIFVHPLGRSPISRHSFTFCTYFVLHPLYRYCATTVR